MCCYPGGVKYRAMLISSDPLQIAKEEIGKASANNSQSTQCFDKLATHIVKYMAEYAL